MRELRDLISLGDRGDESAFSSENGAELLRRYFASVERLDVGGTVTVRDRAKLVAYRESLSVETQPVPEDVELPFVVRRLSSVFVATK